MTFSNMKTLKKLPSFYADVSPAYLPPICHFPSFDEKGNLPTLEEDILNEDEKWLKETTNMPWSISHARKNISAKAVPDISAMLAIGRDNSKFPATIKHILDVLDPAIDYLNPEQPMVVGFDQPLYAIAKRLQWYQPDQYGHQKLVIMLGALYIEIAMLRCLGDWLQDRDGSLLTGHNIAPSKYAQEVTVKVLYKLMLCVFKILNECYSEDEREQRFREWCDKMKERSPQFQFWHTALLMEMDYLIFLRSIRSRNFDPYVRSLDKLLLWVFAFDHYNYAGWMSVHQFDMEMLHKINHLVYQEFHGNGNFVVARTNNDFSSMALDQRHEQLN